MVRCDIDAVNNWVAKSFVGRVDREFGTETPTLAYGCSSCHLGEAGEIFFYCVVAAFRRDAFHSLVSHLK